MSRAAHAPLGLVSGDDPRQRGGDETAYVETTFSFHLYRSEAAGRRADRPRRLDLPGHDVRRRAARAGQPGRLRAGPRGADHLRRGGRDRGLRPDLLERRAHGHLPGAARPASAPARAGAGRGPPAAAPRRRTGRPGRSASGRNVWIGFDACVLPGVTIGEGSIVGRPLGRHGGRAALHRRRRQPGAGHPPARAGGGDTSDAAEQPRKGKIIVFGILFWYPLAGVTYQFLHYLIALRRLGYDPYYVEDSGRWVYDPRINDLSPGRRGQHRGGGSRSWRRTASPTAGPSAATTRTAGVTG